MVRLFAIVPRIPINRIITTVQDESSGLIIVPASYSLVVSSL